MKFYHQLIPTKLILSPTLEEKIISWKQRDDMQTSFTALASRLCRRRQEENKKQKRQFWVRKIFTEERKGRGNGKIFLVNFLMMIKSAITGRKYTSRKYTISNVFSNILQLSHSISLISNYRQKLATENCHFFILIS